MSSTNALFAAVDSGTASHLFPRVEILRLCFGIVYRVLDTVDVVSVRFLRPINGSKRENERVFVCAGLIAMTSHEHIGT